MVSAIVIETLAAYVPVQAAKPTQDRPIKKRNSQFLLETGGRKKYHSSVRRLFAADHKSIVGLRCGNGKGCDIGYAPAISSCEEANSEDACTVAAPDVITAFAVPNPNCPSQDQSVFSGLVALQVALTEQITQPTSDWQVLFNQSFQPST
jgi:hypothetical protein